MTAWALYLATGAFAGLLAGLLGVGGGLVIVPVLAFIFTAQHFPAGQVMHLALGTSLASIVFTSLSSVRAHHARRAVDWRVVRAAAPGIVIGGLAGAFAATAFSTGKLKLLLVCFEFYAATQMLFGIRPTAARGLPGRGGLFAVGGVIGGVSSLLGIGGGSLSVPFLSWCNVNMRTAIGTSAAIGFPIALAATLGYIVSGWPLAGPPPYRLGFVYLPALGGLVLASISTAPVGARLAHRLPVGRLKKIFALLLYGLGVKLAISLL
ncbi:MAG TPA: hypothetical protein DEP05_06415 [Betaproteobacteria bacterium]|nr:hypothetical protein [Betaproteobacteria bacterium]